MSQYIEWSALGNIIVFGILVGAGLPALFAVGVRTLAGPGARGADGEVTLGRKVIAGLCFGIALLTVLGAVAYIAAGGH